MFKSSINSACELTDCLGARLFIADGAELSSTLDSGYSSPTSAWALGDAIIARRLTLRLDTISAQCAEQGYPNTCAMALEDDSSLSLFGIHSTLWCLVPVQNRVHAAIEFYALDDASAASRALTLLTEFVGDYSYVVGVELGIAEFDLDGYA